jgi:hypothetical protein
MLHELLKKKDNSMMLIGIDKNKKYTKMKTFGLIEGDACFPSPCGQNGECSKFGLNGYTCQCFPGWLGQNCEISKPPKTTFSKNTIAK